MRISLIVFSIATLLFRANVALAQDDHGDTAATATPISSGEAISGIIEVAGDVDVFSFAVQPGFSYEFSALSTFFTLRLENQNGVVITSANGATAFSFVATSAETNFLFVTRSFGAGNYSVELSPADDFPEGENVTGAILSAGSSVAISQQNSKDIDRFTVDTSGLTGLVEVVSNPPISNGPIASIRLFDSNNQLLASGRKLLLDVTRANQFKTEIQWSGVAGDETTLSLIQHPITTPDDDFSDDLTAATRIQFGQRMSFKVNSICDDDPFILENARGLSVRTHSDLAVPAFQVLDDAFNLGDMHKGNWRPHSGGDPAALESWAAVFPDLPLLSNPLLYFGVGNTKYVVWPNQQCPGLTTQGFAFDPPLDVGRTANFVLVGDDQPYALTSSNLALPQERYGFIPLNDVTTGVWDEVNIDGGIYRLFLTEGHTYDFKVRSPKWDLSPPLVRHQAFIKAGIPAPNIPLEPPFATGDTLLIDAPDGNHLVRQTYTATETDNHYLLLRQTTIGGNLNRFSMSPYTVEVRDLDSPPTPATTAIAAAVLPSSRSRRVPGAVTFFAVIANGGTEMAAGCRLYPEKYVAANFFFWETDPATNAVIGGRNIPVNIAPGAIGTFLVRWEPLTLIDDDRQPFVFDCRNTDPAPVVQGVNTLDLVVHRDPSPDLVMLAETTAGGGILDIPTSSTAGAYAISTINIGAEGDVTITPKSFGNVLAGPSICETNPATGACLSAPSTTVTRTFAANETATFSVFVLSDGDIPFFPGINRSGVEAMASGIRIGATSVAVRTVNN